MTSTIGSRPNGSCSSCKCPANRAPAKHGWTWMSQTALAVRAPSRPWPCRTGRKIPGTRDRGSLPARAVFFGVEGK